MRFFTKTQPLQSFISDCHNGVIDLSPIFQRNKIWKTDQKRELCRTVVFRDSDIPPFYLWDLGNGTYQVIDGKQRGETLIEFIADAFKLLKSPSVLTIGKKEFKVALQKYSRLEPEVKRRILDTELQLRIVQDVKNNFELSRLFYTLNNGSPVNQAEIRNSIDTVDSNWLKTLANHPVFNKLTQSNRRFEHLSYAGKLSALSLRLSGVTTIKVVTNAKTLFDIHSGDYSRDLAKIKAKIIQCLDLTNDIAPEKARYDRSGVRIVAIDTVTSLYFYAIWKILDRYPNPSLQFRRELWDIFFSCWKKMSHDNPEYARLEVHWRKPWTTYENRYEFFKANVEELITKYFSNHTPSNTARLNP